MTEQHLTNARAVRVWDLPTRIFHWSLVVLFTIAWVSHEADGALFDVHIISGTAVLGLIVFRLIWGLIGSRYALFSNFVKGWGHVREYGEDLRAFRPPYHVGHNPIGGWMIVLLLVLIGLTAIWGFFINDDGYIGPLYATVSPGVADVLSEMHEGVGSFLLLLAIVHIAGVVVHGLMTKENLPRAMVSGDKKVPAGIEAESIKPVASWRILLAAGIAVAAVWSLYL